MFKSTEAILLCGKHVVSPLQLHRLCRHVTPLFILQFSAYHTKPFSPTALALQLLRLDLDLPSTMAAGVVVNVHNNDDDVPTEGSRTYAIIVCVFAALGGLFFGYDQGVTSGVLIMDSFIYDYCVGWHNFTYAQCTSSSADLPSEWTTFTVWYNMAYNLGCLGGAFVGGIVADKLGRRWTIFTAGLLFCAGTSWVCFNKAQAHNLMYIARIIQGFGVGNSSFSLPLFGAEMAPR
ncbi:Sugar transport protein 10 [Phytophthora cinnamomi]|uniref:Sugar transport protein 10 n=2 Tax=Phytophthora cinnamomi TaxID=4785 RepID=UPI00355A5912|nr:Sugar transport protein 10 [Phytophthora cinnamomi]